MPRPSQRDTMFEIFAGDTPVGHSSLEYGDPSMGVAFGKYVAADSYRQIQPECQASRDQSRLALSVRTPLGVQVP